VANYTDGTVSVIYDPVYPTIHDIKPQLRDAGDDRKRRDHNRYLFLGTPGSPNRLFLVNGATSYEANSVVTHSSTQITCSFNIPADAIVGPWDVVVKKPGRTDRNADGRIQHQPCAHIRRQHIGIRWPRNGDPDQAGLRRGHGCYDHIPSPNRISALTLLPTASTELHLSL